MNDNEQLVLDKLNLIINTIKEISELEPSLGDVLISATKISMDLYESLAKEQLYLANDALAFLARVQGLDIADLLSKTYPKGNQSGLIEADENLTQFIMDSAAQYESDIENYRASVNDLIAEFKAVAKEARGQ